MALPLVMIGWNGQQHVVLHLGITFLVQFCNYGDSWFFVGM